MGTCEPSDTDWRNKYKYADILNTDSNAESLNIGFLFIPVGFATGAQVTLTALGENAQHVMQLNWELLVDA